MKNKYCKVTVDGSWIIFSTVKDALTSLICDVESMLDNDGDPVEIKVEMVELSEEEFEALPEFEGF